MSEKETNVLIIAYNDLNNSGVPNVIYQVIKSLNDKCNFDVVVFGNDDYYYQRLLAEGIKINLITFSDFKSKSSVLKKLWNHFFRLRSYYRQAKSLLKQKKYNIVHSFKEYDSWPFLKAGQKIGVKKLIVHGTVVHEEKTSTLLNYLYKRNRRLTIKYGNTFVGVSEHSCKSTFGSKPFTVIYNSYDEKKYNSSISLLNEDELVITQVATYNSNKNQLFSIGVINEIRKIYPKCKLNLIGKETEKGTSKKCMT